MRKLLVTLGLALLLGCGGTVPPIDPCIAFPSLPNCKPTPTPPPTTTTTTTTTVPVTLPTPIPTPTPSPGCSAPVGAEWIDAPVGNTYTEPVKAVLAVLSHCDVGSDCPLPYNMQTWQAMVEDALRKGMTLPNGTVIPPFCSGQQAPDTDEIVVKDAPSVSWEGVKVFACTPALPTDPPNFDTCPVPGRGKVRWAIHTGFSQPVGGTIPTPEPTPTPTPTPPPTGDCPLVGEGWLWTLKPHGGQQLDATPYVTNPTHTVDQPYIGCGVNRCPLSCEKGPVACGCQVKLVGDAKWLTTSGECDVFTTSSSFTVKVASGSCNLSVQGSVDPESKSGEWPVFAAVPACNVGSDGFCH